MMLNLEQQLSEGEVDSSSPEDPLAGRAATETVITLNDRRPARRARTRLQKVCAQVGVRLGHSQEMPEGKAEETGLAQEQVIDSMIVVRALMPGKHRRRRWANWSPREILSAVAGGTVTLMLLLLLIRYIQTM